MIQLTWPLYLALPLITLIVGMLAGAIRRHEVKLHAEEKTQTALAATELDRDWWHREAERLAKLNTDLRSCFHQSAIYDRQMAEYLTLRIANEQDASLLGKEEKDNATS